VVTCGADLGGVGKSVGFSEEDETFGHGAVWSFEVPQGAVHVQNEPTPFPLLHAA